MTHSQHRDRNKIGKYLPGQIFIVLFHFSPKLHQCLQLADTPTMNSNHTKEHSKAKRNEFWIMQTTVLITTINSNRPYNYTASLFQKIILKKVNSNSTYLAKTNVIPLKNLTYSPFT